MKTGEEKTLSSPGNSKVVHIETNRSAKEEKEKPPIEKGGGEGGNLK